MLFECSVQLTRIDQIELVELGRDHSTLVVVLLIIYFVRVNACEFTKSTNKKMRIYQNTY